MVDTADEASSESQRPAPDLQGRWVHDDSQHSEVVLSRCQFLFRSDEEDVSGAYEVTAVREDRGGELLLDVRFEVFEAFRSRQYFGDPSSPPMISRVKQIVVQNDQTIHLWGPDYLGEGHAQNRPEFDAVWLRLGTGWRRSQPWPGMPRVTYAEDPNSCLASVRALRESGCEATAARNGTCESPTDLGTVRGDAGHDAIDRQSIGGAVFTLRVSETAWNWSVRADGTPVRARIQLSSASGRYGLQVLEGPCSDAATQPVTTEWSREWRDDGASIGADAKVVTVRVVDLAERAVCDGWTLSVRGNE